MVRLSVMLSYMLEIFSKCEQKPSSILHLTNGSLVVEPNIQRCHKSKTFQYCVLLMAPLNLYSVICLFLMPRWLYCNFTYLSSCKSPLLSLHPPTITNWYWILLHIDQKNRLCHVREHCLIRLCIFHMAFLQYNTTHSCIRISIIHAECQYIWYIYFSVCFTSQAWFLFFGGRFLLFFVFFRCIWH